MLKVQIYSFVCDFMKLKMFLFFQVIGSDVIFLFILEIYMFFFSEILKFRNS